MKKLSLELQVQKQVENIHDGADIVLSEKKILSEKDFILIPGISPL